LQIKKSNQYEIIQEARAYLLSKVLYMYGRLRDRLNIYFPLDNLGELDFYNRGKIQRKKIKANYFLR